MKTTITLEKAREIFKGKWEIERLDLLEKTFNEVKEFVPCEMKIEVLNYDNSATELHNPIITLQTIPNEINIRFNTQFKKYLIFADFNQLKNISKYTIDEVKKELIEPVQIGKLSLKKITDWINYYNEIYKKLVAENETNGSKKEEFLKSIEGLNVVWDSNKKSGSILRNGVELEFRIEETYVSKKITINYKVANDVENFIKLSDNQYQN